MIDLVEVLEACSARLSEQAGEQENVFDLSLVEQQVKVLLKGTRARLQAETEELQRKLDAQAREEEAQVAAQNAARLVLLSPDALRQLARAVANRLLEEIR